MDVLDNGVYICDLANIIQQKAEECVQQGQCNDVRGKYIYIFFFDTGMNFYGFRPCVNAGDSRTTE